MFKRFVSLQWKQFRRSSYFEVAIAIKILMILGILYFAGMAILAGVGGYFILQKVIPEVDPLLTLNQYLIYWFLFDLGIRYFIQQMPVINIKPLLIIPIKRKKVVQFLLGKTILSFFNILPLLFFIPFSITLIVKGYHPLYVTAWFFGVLALIFLNNFTVYLINKTNIYFFIIVGLVLAFIGLQRYEIFDITAYAQIFFYGMYSQPIWILLPILLMALAFYANYQYYLNHFYIDGAISKKAEKVKALDLKFVDKFGKIAPFLKNDIKLILRNARPKQVLLTSFFFLFYGLFFFTMDVYKDLPAMLAFASMFITGGFLLTFGQLVPSWDSEYYKLMMSQNIPYREYLKSKLVLMIFAVVVSTILSLPYLYFGWDIYKLILAGASFNIGLNSFITLYGGALNRVPVELNVKAKAFQNTNGFNVTQLLISLPKILAPIIIFYIPYKFISFDAGIIALVLSGLLGLIFQNQFLDLIEKLYQKQKYKTIAAFDEKK
ncbi:DUF5687 family protein [Flavobacterium sp. CS20]|uniref:DUF5687 family protein n=1 Tax=Flavobacterium sp. CS20 TaxID=2775246 RepID=UPI001B3A43B1|nr:DUF5687 family protein [Flavobacterium sp. CS20]QTY26038.1 hypothetical protein IGB25_08500 [Flavobacterium sp. CS20]